MRALRTFFLRLQSREKLLLVVFTLLIVAVWGSNFNRRAWQFQKVARSTSVDLAMQQQWLDNRVAIENAAKKTAARLDPTRTLDGTALLAVVGSLAAEAGLRNTSSGESRDESNGQFNVHTLEFRIDRAEWEPLIKFYLSLQAKSPYIGIERCALIPDRANPALTTASLRVSAPEVVQ